MQSFTEVSELALLWFDMASILNEPDVDRSYYKVFRDLLDAEISQSKGGILLSIGFRLNLESLGKNVDLMTGTCMSAIWEAARPSAPTTHESWAIYNEISSAIAKFETDTAYHIGIVALLRALTPLGGTETLDAVCSLRTSFRQLIHDIQAQSQFGLRPQVYIIHYSF
jgi:hypothetical protein